MMNIRPSAVEQFIATLPEELQCLALQVIKEEHDRFEREDFTTEEKEMFRLASSLGESARQTIDKVITDIINMKGGDKMKLTGLNEIKQHLDVTEATAMDMILIQGLPAKKDKSGAWVSDTDKIAVWQGADAKKIKRNAKAKAEAEAKTKTEAEASAKAEAEDKKD